MFLYHTVQVLLWLFLLTIPVTGNLQKNSKGEAGHVVRGNLLRAQPGRGGPHRHVRNGRLTSAVDQAVVALILIISNIYAISQKNIIDERKYEELVVEIKSTNKK